MIDNIIRPLANECRPLREFWDETEPIICGDLGSGLAAFVVGIGGQAIFGIGLLAFSIMSTKRFNVNNSDEYELDDIEN